METIATNSVKLGATAVAASVAPAVSSLPVGTLLELMASSICGAAIYMLWAEDVALWKRLCSGGISATLGVLMGPFASSLIPYGDQEVALNVGGAVVSALAVVTISVALKILSDGKMVSRWIDRRIEKVISGRRSGNDDVN